VSKIGYICIKRKFNPLSANVEYTPHDAYVACEL